MVVRRHQAVPCILVHDRLVNGVQREQLVAREVHLGNDALRELRAEHGEVDVGRAPCVEVVLPRVRPGLDGGEGVGAVGTGDATSDAGEVGVERGGVLVTLVDVAAGGVGLPDFHELARNRAAVAVQDAAGDDDAFALGFAVVLDGQVRLQRVHVLVTESGRVELDRFRVGMVQALGGVAQDAAAVRRIVQARHGLRSLAVLQGLSVLVADRFDLGTEVRLRLHLSGVVGGVRLGRRHEFL